MTAKKKPMVTAATDFGRVGPDGPHLFGVHAGVDAGVAISTASCLINSTRMLIQDGVDNGMSSEMAYICAFALDAAEKLVDSAGVGA